MNLKRRKGVMKGISHTPGATPRMVCRKCTVSLSRPRLPQPMCTVHRSRCTKRQAHRLCSWSHRCTTASAETFSPPSRFHGSYSTDWPTGCLSWCLADCRSVSLSVTGRHYPAVRRYRQGADEVLFVGHARPQAGAQRQDRARERGTDQEPADKEVSAQAGGQEGRRTGGQAGR